MVALDDHAFSGPGRGLKLTLGPLVGAIVILAVLLVLGAILARGFSENGFRLGSQLAWRYASFVFVAALAMGPLCRITAHFFPAFTPPESLSRKLSDHPRRVPDSPKHAFAGTRPRWCRDSMKGSIHEEQLLAILLIDVCERDHCEGETRGACLF